MPSPGLQVKINRLQNDANSLLPLLRSERSSENEGYDRAEAVASYASVAQRIKQARVPQEDDKLDPPMENYSRKPELRWSEERLEQALEDTRDERELEWSPGVSPDFINPEYPLPPAVNSPGDQQSPVAPMRRPQQVWMPSGPSQSAQQQREPEQPERTEDDSEDSSPPAIVNQENPPESDPDRAAPEDAPDPLEAQEPTNQMESSDGGVYAVRYRSQQPDDPNNIGTATGMSADDGGGGVLSGNGDAPSGDQNPSLRFKNGNGNADDGAMAGKMPGRNGSGTSGQKRGFVRRMLKF